jgi:hypothetical protein
MIKYDKEPKTLTKGELFTEIEIDNYDGKEYRQTLRVDRVNKNTISVTCVVGYMKNSSWKIHK